MKKNEKKTESEDIVKVTSLSKVSYIFPFKIKNGLLVVYQTFHYSSFCVCGTHDKCKIQLISSEIYHYQLNRLIDYVLEKLIAFTVKSP